MTVEKGQVWRRRKTGKLLRVTRAENLGSERDPYYDVHWETVEKPYRRGVSYEDYWRKNCELVDRELEDEDAEQEQEQERWAATVAPEWVAEDDEGET